MHGGKVREGQVLDLLKRLERIKHLLERHPKGLTTAEILEDLRNTKPNLTRQTARNDINRLKDLGFLVETDGRHRLVADTTPGIDLSPAQMWLLYLLLRRMARANQHLNSSVRELLSQVASLFSEEIAEEVERPVSNGWSDTFDQVFEELVTCWDRQQHVEVRYRSLNADQEKQLVIAPWWFEPGVWSEGYYLICGEQQDDGQYQSLSLKLNRILEARCLKTTFERPQAREITRQLEKSWGIWTNDGESILVKLRFAGRWSQRLYEARWHPTQDTVEQADRSILWTARVSEPLEMLPWIRGWGPDVEVLEPLSLRQRIAEDAQKTARLYGETS